MTHAGPGEAGLGEDTRMAREKHFYPYSNQFLLGDGTVVDARQ